MTATSPPPVAEADPTPDPSQPVARLKHRRGSRWMHWINFPLLTIMIWSGLRIYWANDVYDISLGGWEVFNFFPDSVNDRLGLDRKLARGMAFHFSVGWLFAINGIGYGLYSLITGEWRKVAPDRHSFSDGVKVVRHDLHLGGDLPPQPRYNAMQRLTYSGVIVLGALALISGFAIFKPIQLSWLTALFGGYENARAVHFIVTLAFLAFFVVHILQVLRAGWRNFTSMVTGYEVEKPRSDLDTRDLNEKETTDA